MKRKTRCRNCFITDRCKDTAIDSKGLCNHCNDLRQGIKPETKHLLSAEEKITYTEDLDRILTTAKGSGDYDCIVGFSGGKDSIYLIHRLRKDYPHLRILAATVSVGYVFNKNAVKNMDEVLGKLDVDHITIKPRDSFYKKFFSHMLQNRLPGGYKKGAYDSDTVSEESSSLCVYCHGIVHDLLLNYAVQQRIPLHITGASPAQPLYWFYKQDAEELKRPNIPYFMRKEPFDERDRVYCWEPDRYSDDKSFPTVLFPFHVWDYNSEKIRREILEAGLISSYRKTSMLSTNCTLNLVMSYIDMKIDGHFNMLPYVSFLIRNGLADRKQWKGPLLMVENVLLRLKNRKIKILEKKLGFNVDEIITKFRHQGINGNASAS